MLSNIVTFRATALACLLAAAGCASDAPSTGPASTGGSQARSSLDALRGCLSVRYQFTEDTTADFLIEENIEYMDVHTEGERVVARNYLILDEENAFLHWIQEWTPLDDGRWALRVTDGSGALRYETEGVWRLNQWESGAALAAKPTRDAARRDYDVLERRNAMQFTANGWVHSEINRKLAMDGTLVATELGWIVYRRRASDEACAPAVNLAASQALLASRDARPPAQAM